MDAGAILARIEELQDRLDDLESRFESFLMGKEREEELAAATGL